MIDLHTHTDESDGTFAPDQLVAEASRIGLEALAVTDHDTFTGFEGARPFAEKSGLELLCGIELSTKFRGQSVHLLAYFLRASPTPGFGDWVISLQEGRRQRNVELIEKLCSAGMPITMEDVARRGRKLVARPHFAAAMIEKGYAQSIDEAFDKYLDEAGSCYVPRDEPLFHDAVSRVRDGGGIAVLPHPNRIKASNRQLDDFLDEMACAGLGGIEVYHSDHTPAQRDLYAALARKYKLKVSGGSDFHGAAKPKVALGSGIANNLAIPYEILKQLRELE